MSLRLRADRLQADERDRKRYNEIQRLPEPEARFPSATYERGDREYNDLVRRVLKSGAKFAAGSDMDWYFPRKTRGQASVSRFPVLHQAGMPPLDVIRSITANAAEMSAVKSVAARRKHSSS
jgi:imidazolonepropionase-like amidohydrolase